MTLTKTSLNTNWHWLLPILLALVSVTVLLHIIFRLVDSITCLGELNWICTETFKWIANFQRCFDCTRNWYVILKLLDGSVSVCCHMMVWWGCCAVMGHSAAINEDVTVDRGPGSRGVSQPSRSCTLRIVTNHVTHQLWCLQRSVPICCYS